MKNLEFTAQAFAEHYHGIIDQRRKYTDEPYIVHPAAVVAIVRAVPHTPAMLAAAWMHDVLEDTPATVEEMRRTFGQEVTSLVEMLTNVSRPEDGNRAKRKAIDLAHLAKASPEAKTIKLADIIDNTNSIITRDPSFARTYLAEKARALIVLRDGDPDLWFHADALIASSYAKVAAPLASLQA